MIFKNKKGFTLVELIAVIAIIGVISTIAVVSFSTISKKAKEKEYDALAGSVKAQALNFYEATNQSRFYVQTLIDYGLLGTDNNTYEIINPINDEAMNCYIVYISDDNFRLEKNNDCSKDLYEFTKPTITYCNGEEYNSSVWHNNSTLCLKATLPDIFINYEVDEIIWENKNDGNFTIKSPQLNLKFDDNTINEETYTVRIKLKDDTITVAQADVKIKNDRVNPEVKSFTVVNNNGKNYNSNSIIYEITANDIKSGVQSYCFSETDNPLSCNWVEANTGSYNINKEDGTGGIFLSYAFAKDAAGNISKAFENKYGLYKTCSELIYEDGPKCSSSCNGTYNRLAYDKYFNVRCEKFDTQSGGSSCSESNCSYTIRYNANGGSGTMRDQIVSYNNPVDISNNNFTRNGYTFDSWNTKADGSGTEFSAGQEIINLTSTPNEIINLYAQWKKIKYTISYNCTNVKSCPKDSEVEYGENYLIDNNIEPLNDYIFIGYIDQKSRNIYKNKEYIGQVEDNITLDVALVKAEASINMEPICIKHTSVIRVNFTPNCNFSDFNMNLSGIRYSYQYKSTDCALKSTKSRTGSCIHDKWIDTQTLSSSTINSYYHTYNNGEEDYEINHVHTIFFRCEFHVTYGNREYGPFYSPESSVTYSLYPEKEGKCL